MLLLVEDIVDPGGDSVDLRATFRPRLTWIARVATMFEAWMRAGEPR